MAVQRSKAHPQKLSLRKAKDGRQLYSQVVVVAGTGRMIFIAGQIARDVNGNVVGKGDMRKQIEQVGENIKACLESVDATLDDIVKTTTYVTDIDDYFKHADVRLRYFGDAVPTSTTVEVRRLGTPDFLVEIEAFAIAD